MLVCTCWHLCHNETERPARCSETHLNRQIQVDSVFGLNIKLKPEDYYSLWLRAASKSTLCQTNKVKTDSGLCSSVMKTVWTELSPPAGPCRPLLVFLCPVGLFSFSWTDVIFAKGHSSRKPSEEAQSITSCFLSHTQQNLKTKLGSHAERNLFQQENIFFSPAFTQGKDHSEYLFLFFFYLIG